MKNIFLCAVLGFSFQAQAADTTPQLINPAKKVCAEFDRVVKTGTSLQKLNHFTDFQWKYTMSEFPEYATYAGFPGQNDRLTSDTELAQNNRDEILKCQFKSLQKISAAGLKNEDALSLKILLRGLSLRIESLQFPEKYLVIDQLSGFHERLPGLLLSAPKATKKDYEDRIARLKLAPTRVEEMLVLLKAGVKIKVTPVKMFLEKVPPQIEATMPADPKLSPFFESFKDIKADLTAQEKTELQNKALAVISDSVYPAFKKLNAYLISDYIPNARTSIALADMPNGKAWYAFNVRQETTTNRSAEELHQLGLSEVARISTEMEKIKTSVKFSGDLKKFNQYLLTDSKFFYTSAKDLLAGYRDIGKRIDAELPRLFKVLPRTPYGVKAIPDFKAADSPAAYYNGGTLEAGRAGVFEANTSNLKGRPIWAMESLTAHEAVPGHHLQISIAQEQEGLPQFRRNGGDTAYVEGWALYAEGLGDSLELYKDPYSKYGNLSYEMLRAVRLVVDTGMHSKGWTREQAISFYTDHVAEPRKEAEVEINRYITWPGQALAYKVGQLKFLELREKAKKELADKFDIREYHEEVLKHGSLPLDLLETQFNTWLEKKSLQANSKNETKQDKKLK